MTWKQFKDSVEALGITDDMNIDLIDWLEGYAPRVDKTTLSTGDTRLEIVDDGLNYEPERKLSYVMRGLEASEE